MKKTALVSLVASLLLAGAPLASAQSYYQYPAAYPANSYATAYSCISLTAYQAFGSTDAGTAGQVTLLQRFLNSTGNLSGVSGYFDNGTYGAVVNYQSSHGIPATGTVGPQTRAAINAQSCGSSVGYNPGYATYPYNNYGMNYNYGTNYGTGYGNYGYNSAPTVTSLSTTVGQSGTSVTIYGNFGGPLPTVHFGSQVVSANLNSNSSLTFVVPSYSSGSYSVYVSNSYGSSNSLSFSVTSYNNCNSSYNYGYSYGGAYNYSYDTCNCATYQTYPYTYGYNNNSNCNSNTNYNGNNSNAQPYLSSITGPSTVSAGSNNTWSVSSYGQNGDPVTLSIDWGDGSQYGNSLYGTSNQTRSFSHTYSSNGTYTIRVTATDSTTGAYRYSTLSVSVNGSGYYNGYPYNNGGYNQPSISYLSSTSGRAGNTITIYGYNFSGNTVVYFGNSAYTPRAMTDSSIVFDVPYISQGNYSVSVRNGNGNSSNSVSFSIY